MFCIKFMSNDLKYSFVPDEVLQNTTVTSKNPFGAGVYFQGYRYSGVYEFSAQNEKQPTSTRNPNAEPLGDDEDNEIES